MDLIVFFDKTMLNLAENEIMEMCSPQCIGIVEFCYVLLKSIRRYWASDIMNKGLLGMLCQIFDSVDVDSRGIIEWSDFVAFVLRSGRNRFKETSSYSNIDYVQRLDVPAVLPARQLLFIEETQTLYAFDGDMPLIRLFRKNGELSGTVCPNESILRLMKVRSLGKQPYYATKKSAKLNAVKKTKFSQKPSTIRGSVVAMAYLERKRHLVVSTSDCFVSFWNSRLQHLVDFVQVDIPQVGMTYCSRADVLLSWPGDSEDHDYRVWDTNTRKILYKFGLHTGTILVTMEIKKLGVMVSSSIDRALIVWPVRMLTKQKKHAVAPADHEEEGSKVDDDVETYLHGPSHAIRSIAYAPDHDLILGAGFDYDVYGWDTTTYTVQMKMVGHRHSVVAVAVVYNPTERAVTADDKGNIKIWNLDRDQGTRSHHLQAMSVQGTDIQQVFAFTPTVDRGATLVLLAERLYLYDLVGGAAEESRVVPGGMAVCERTSKVWVISRRLSYELSLRTGKQYKVYETLAEQRVDMCPTARIGGREISFDDITTCSASDKLGKKLFIGTHSGRVLMYDATTLGLICQLSHEETLTGREHFGAVVAMKYADGDELLFVALTGGVLKVYSGCHHSISSDVRSTLETNMANASGREVQWCQLCQGGNAPPTPQLLRVNFAVHESNIIEMDVCEEIGLVAIAGADGTVWILDYFTLLIRCIYSAPFIDKVPAEIVSLRFVPGAPLLLGADSHGRLTLWSLYPLKPNWVFTWTVSQGIRMFDFPRSRVDGTEAGSPTTASPGGDRNSPMAVGTELDENVDDVDDSGVNVASLDCIVWENTDHCNAEGEISSRPEWTVVVGDSNGRVFLIDITDVLVRINITDFVAMSQAMFLNRHSLPYQQLRRNDFKDGLEEYQVKEILDYIQHPIGMDGSSGSGLFSGKEKVGYRGTNCRDIKQRARWQAHPHAVSQLRPLQMKSQNHISRRELSKLTSLAQIRPSYGSRPYAFITVSEYGSCKRWTWTGSHLDDDSVYGNEASEEFTSLLGQLHDNAHTEVADEEIIVDQGNTKLENLPLGAGEERIHDMVNWLYPILLHSHGAKLLALAVGPRKNMKQLRSGDGDFTPVTESPADKLKRRPSISDKLWGNDFIDNPVEPIMESSMVSWADDDATFISTGIRAKTDDDDDLTVNSKGERESAMSVSALRRKVDHSRKRQEAAKEAWDSKVRFPNMASEAVKKEFFRKPMAEDEGYSIPSPAHDRFLDDRAEVQAVVDRRMRRKNAQMQLAQQHLQQRRRAQHSNPSANTDLERFDPIDETPTEIRSTLVGGLRQSPVALRLANKSRPSSPGTSLPGTGRAPSSTDKSLVSIARMLSQEEIDVSRFEEDLADILGGRLSSRDDNGENGRPLTRQQSFECIQRTMSRFDSITNESDKKYAYNTWRKRAGKSPMKRTEVSRGSSVDVEVAVQQSNSTFRQENILGSRYGPYKTKDITAFEDFVSRLPLKFSAVDVDTPDPISSECFPDVLQQIRMGLVFDFREVLTCGEVAKSKTVWRMMMGIRDRADGTILKNDIFNHIFVFASDAEKLRIYTFGIVRAVLLEVMKSLRHQNILPTLPRDIAGTPMQASRTFKPLPNPSKKVVPSQSLTSLSQATPQRDGILTGGFNTLTKPTGTISKKRKDSSMEGWIMKKSILEELKKFFDELYNASTGSVVGSEVVEICQNSTVLASMEKPPNIQVTSAAIGTFFEEVLKIDIEDDDGNDELISGTTPKNKRVKALQNFRSLGSILKEVEDEIDVGA